MRIGIDARTLTRPRTGVHTDLLNLLRHLPEVDSRNEYVLFFDTPHLPAVGRDGFFRPVYVPAPLVRGRVGRNWGAPVWLNLALPRALARERIDVAYYPNFLAPLIGGPPRVIKVHDLAMYAAPGRMDPAWRAYFTAFFPRSLRAAEQIVVPSRHAAGELAHRFRLSPDRIQQIYPAADPAFRVLADPGRLDELRRRWGLGPHVVLYVGTLTARKNPRTLVRAFGRVRFKVSGALHLVLRGSEGYGAREVLEEAARHGLAERVRVIGELPTEDLVTLYNLATLFAFPSVYEGFGYPVLEAMACGTPVIASNAAALPEVVGDAGVLAGPEDVPQWAARIEALLADDDLRMTLRRKGLARAGQFSWTRTARATVEVFERAAGTARPAGAVPSPPQGQRSH